LRKANHKNSALTNTLARINSVRRIEFTFK